MAGLSITDPPALRGEEILALLVPKKTSDTREAQTAIPTRWRPGSKILEGNRVQQDFCIGKRRAVPIY